MICAQEDSDVFRAFSKRIRKKAAANRIPVHGTVELTANCNLTCAHCYIRPPGATPDPLSTDDWRIILDKLAAAGCLWLGITGGEPLLRSDFKDIFRYAKARGFLITLLTNGTLIDDDMADFLSAHAPSSVEVSIYGAGRETCEAVTGSAGSFDDCLAGVRRLRARGVKTVLKMTILRQNAADLGAMQSLAAELNVPFRFDGVLNDAIPGAAVRAIPRLSAPDLVALEFSVPQGQALWRERAAFISGDESAKEKMFGCAAGITGFHVTFEGRLCPCVIVREPSVDLLRESFSAGWNGAILQSVEAVFRPTDRCYHCELAPLCTTCPGFGLLEKGDPAAASDFICDIAKTRKTAMFERDEKHGEGFNEVTVGKD